MKILVMNNGYLSHSVSGGTNHLFGVAEALAEEHDVVFIAPVQAADLLPGGVRRKYYSSHFPRSLVGTVLVYLLRIVKAARLARREPADVVLSLSLLYDVLPAIIHKRAHSSAVGLFVFHLIPKRRGGRFRRNLQFRISSLAQRVAVRLYGATDVVFAGNSGVRDELKAHGISERRLRIQHPAINEERIRDARPIETYDALFIGRMVARKGIFDLVEAARGLDLRVGFVGEGEDRIALENLIRESGLDDQFDVTGHLPDSEAYGLLRGCRCLVLPSYEEGYGMVIAEAMVAGKPVITYELPHYRDIFGDGPIYVPVGDTTALRSALERAAEGHPRGQPVRGGSEGVRFLNGTGAAAQVLDALRT